MSETVEVCPICGTTDAIRPKLVLIDEAWHQEPGKDPREAYFADLRADDLKPSEMPANLHEQFVDGFYCDRCNRAFVPTRLLREDHRRYK